MKSVVTVLKTIKCEIECHTGAPERKKRLAIQADRFHRSRKKGKIHEQPYSAPLSFFSLSPRKDTISKYGT